MKPSRKDITDKMVVEAALAYQRDRRLHILDRLMARTGYPIKVCWRALERASDRDLVEYGCSLRTAWPTTKGMELLTP